MTRRTTHVPPGVRFRIRWVELSTAVAVVGLIVALILIVGSMIQPPTESTPVPAPPAPVTVQNLDEPETVWLKDLKPCPTEDSDHCYWDARQHGNGTGRSFVALDGFTIFIEHADLPTTESGE